MKDEASVERESREGEGGEKENEEKEKKHEKSPEIILYSSQESCGVCSYNRPTSRHQIHHLTLRVNMKNGSND